MRQLVEERSEILLTRLSGNILAVLGDSDVVIHHHTVELRCRGEVQVAVVHGVVFLIIVDGIRVRPSVLIFVVLAHVIGHRCILTRHHKAHGKLGGLNKLVTVEVVGSKIDVLVGSFQRLGKALHHLHVGVRVWLFGNAPTVDLLSIQDDVHDAVVGLVRLVGVAAHAKGTRLLHGQEGEGAVGHVKVILAQRVFFLIEALAPVVQVVVGKVLEADNDHDERYVSLVVIRRFDCHREQLIACANLAQAGGVNEVRDVRVARWAYAFWKAIGVEGADGICHAWARKQQTKTGQERERYAGRCTAPYRRTFYSGCHENLL